MNRVRIYPRAGFASRMVGGQIQGSNESATGGFVTLATIKTAPKDQAWSQILFKNTKPYRFVRYFGPSGSYTNIAELQFFDGKTPIKGTPYGTFGSRDNSGNDYKKAFDGDVKTFFDAVAPNSQYLGIEIKSETSSTQSAPIVIGDGLRHYHIGNSLTDTIGEYMQQIAFAAGYKDDFVDRQTIPGAPLYLNQQSDGGFGTNHKIAFEKFAPLTDLVMQTFIQNGDSDDPEFSLKLYEQARVKSPQIRPWIYGQWDGTGSGSSNSGSPSWEARNVSYMRMYVAHVLNFNAQSKGKKAQLVPGGLALINLKKAFDGGKLPGMTNFFSSNFEDDLHVNMNGRYFIGLVTYAALYNKSPVGLPVVKINNNPPTLTPVQNRVYQQVAWDTVRDYNATNGSALGVTVPAEIDARAFIGRSPDFYNDPLIRYIREKTSFTYLITAPSAGQYELKVNMVAGKSGEQLEVFLNHVKAGVITPNLNGEKPTIDSPPLSLNLKAGLNLLRLYVPTLRPYEINTLRITPVGGKLKNTMPFLNLSTFGAESKGGAPFVVNFTVSDEETKPSDVKITASSSNTKIVPQTSIKIDSDSSVAQGNVNVAGYKMTVAPLAGQIGDVDIIVSATDGGGINRIQRFKLSVK